MVRDVCTPEDQTAESLSLTRERATPDGVRQFLIQIEARWEGCAVCCAVAVGYQRVLKLSRKWFAESVNRSKKNAPLITLWRIFV